MHLMGSGTTARLVSVVHGLPSSSESQQQFITAKEGYSREVSARVSIWEMVLRVFHFRFISVGSFLKFAKKYQYQFSAITKSSAQIKNLTKYNINGTNGPISRINYSKKHHLSVSQN